jgi:tripartite motif-containing protein 71
MYSWHFPKNIYLKENSVLLGTALGEFSQPQGIAIDSTDNIYITSFTSLSNQIEKFTSNGTFITSWGSLGFGSGRFTNPSGITTDSLNNVYVVDFGENNNVQKFDSTGSFITKWGSMRSDDGQFRHPASIAI